MVICLVLDPKIFFHYSVHALVSPILFGFWLFLYTDHPDTHPCVSQREKDQILSGKTEAEIGISGFMPYR